MTELLNNLDAPSDAELITRVRGGDADAYGTLFARHVEAARRLARQLARGHDADDLVSEAFTKVMGVLQEGGGPDVAFRAYLLTAIRRLHVDRVRFQARLTTSEDMSEFDPGVPFQDTMVAQFETGAAAKAFATLPERWQLVLWHLEVEGQKPSEVAPLLGMTPNSVSALAYRAREGLRQAFLSAHLSDIAVADCRWVTEHLGGYIRKGLSKRDATRIETHLRGCRSCMGMYLELDEVNSNIAAIIGPLLLGSLAAAYLAGAGAGAAASSVVAIVDRAKDFIAANLVPVAAGTAAASVAAATVVGADQIQTTQPDPVGTLIVATAPSDPGTEAPQAVGLPLTASSTTPDASDPLVLPSVGPLLLAGPPVEIVPEPSSPPLLQDPLLEPADPVDLIIAAGPPPALVDPVAPVEGAEPAAPADPVEPADPAAPVDAVVPGAPSGPGDPIDPGEPAGPAAPADQPPDPPAAPADQPPDPPAAPADQPPDPPAAPADQPADPPAAPADQPADPPANPPAAPPANPPEDPPDGGTSDDGPASDVAVSSATLDDDTVILVVARLPDQPTNLRVRLASTSGTTAFVGSAGACTVSDNSVTLAMCDTASRAEGAGAGRLADGRFRAVLPIDYPADLSYDVLTLTVRVEGNDDPAMVDNEVQLELRPTGPAKTETSPAPAPADDPAPASEPAAAAAPQPEPTPDGAASPISDPTPTPDQPADLALSA